MGQRVPAPSSVQHCVAVEFRRELAIRDPQAGEEISRLAPGVNLWYGHLTIPSRFIYPERNGLWGCGVVLVSMTATEVQTCARLGTALDRISADDVLASNEPGRLDFAVIE